MKTSERYALNWVWEINVTHSDEDLIDVTILYFVWHPEYSKTLIHLHFDLHIVYKEK